MAQIHELVNFFCDHLVNNNSLDEKFFVVQADQV